MEATKIILFFQVSMREILQKKKNNNTFIWFYDTFMAFYFFLL